MNYWLHNRSRLTVRWHQDGYWLLRYSDAVVPLPFPDASHYRDKEAIARDAYFHLYKPKFGDTVMHVGAGAGLEVNLLSRLVGPNGHVYLIEAHPKTYQWLVRRIEVSRLKNVTPIHVAISDSRSVIYMTDEVEHMLNQVRTNGEIQVETKTLQDVITEFRIQRVDLLTMNIEGAEKAAVRGIGSAKSVIDRFAISCHDFLADRGGDSWTRTKAEVESMLTDYGYRVTNRDPSDLRDWTRDYVYAEIWNRAVA